MEEREGISKHRHIGDHTTLLQLNSELMQKVNLVNRQVHGKQLQKLTIMKSCADHLPELASLIPTSIKITRQGLICLDTLASWKPCQNSSPVSNPRRSKMKISLAVGSLTMALVVCIAVLPSPASTAKILMPVFFSSKSHKITYMRLLEELASRGHEITLISPVKPFGKPVKGIREVYTFNTDQFMEHINMFDDKEKGRTLNPFDLIDVMDKTCNASYDLPQVREIIEKESFDLVIVQPLFNDCVLGWVHKTKAPFIVFTLTGVHAGLAEAIAGNHFPPSFVVVPILKYDSEMNFYQRFINFGLGELFKILRSLVFESRTAAMYRDKLGDPTIPMPSEIWSNASLILSNGHFSINGHKPMLPDVIDVGGIHSHPPKPLSKELEDFVSGSGNEGFVFFSMGSHMKGMSDSKRKTFLRVFSRLKQRVLWKWESDTMEGEEVPNNVKLSSWLPQQDLLGHPKMRLFITHCGGGSTEEAIYHGTPLLGIPIFGDQIKNAEQAEGLGMLVHLDWNDIAEESLEKAILEVLNNPKYAANAKQISKVFRDQPDDPLTRGVFWVEYVLRHKGAPHLRSASRKLNFFQYHSYDVMAAYLAIISILLYLIVAIVKFFCRCFCPKKTTPMKLKKN